MVAIAAGATRSAAVEADDAELHLFLRGHQQNEGDAGGPCANSGGLGLLLWAGIGGSNSSDTCGQGREASAGLAKLRRVTVAEQ